MKEVIINSKQSLEAYKKFLDAQFEQHKYLRPTLKTGKQRTQTQNKSLHLFCEMLANILNDGGIDFRVFIKEGYPVPFNDMLVKEYIWRPIQKAITGKESTIKPAPHEYALIYDAVNTKMVEHGIYVPWPCKETRDGG